jgi:TM2 domain-containing membrane protein YozV
MVLLWFFFGWLGAHRFYTRDHLYATMMLLFGWATLFTWNIIDVLFAAKEVDRVNEDIEYEILQNINRAH